MITIDRNSKNVSLAAQFGILLGLVGAGLIIGALVSVVIWKAMTGRPILAMESDILKPQFYNAVMTIQVVSTFIMFVLPTYFVALISYRRPLKFMGLTNTCQL